MNEEEQYKKELEAHGVDIPVETESKTVETESKVEPETKVEEADEEVKVEEHKKRSIYDEYKEKKSELKSERELREKAERERDEYAEKLKTLGNASTPEEKKEAKDELEQFAETNKLDPIAIKQMRDLFLKDVKLPEIDESLKKGLSEFQEWKTKNQGAIEKQQFEDEFQKVTPTIKELFPTASVDELKAIKKEVDNLAHSKDWNTKDLDYIVFKNKEVISALVSPKKRGMEGKGRQDVNEVTAEFNPNADYSKMTFKEREVWEETYKNLTKSDGLIKDGQGRRLLI